MVEDALGGDPNALRLCIERLLPRARHRAVETALPVLEDGNYGSTIDTILQEILLGNITPDEGRKMITLIEDNQSRKEVNSIIQMI
jgi:hypothetical protein